MYAGAEVGILTGMKKNWGRIQNFVIEIIPANW
jgi:hypothetical protein